MRDRIVMAQVLMLKVLVRLRPVEKGSIVMIMVSCGACRQWRTWLWLAENGKPGNLGTVCP